MEVNKDVAQNDSYLDKTSSKIVKGTAILIMLIHHIFGFEKWLINDNTFSGLSILGNNLLSFIGKNGRICVAMFAFITGYAYYISFNKNEINNKKYILKKIIDFLINYWIILFFIYIPINFIFKCKYELTILSFIKNMFGIGELMVYFGWYVWFYIVVMLTLPIVITVSRKIKYSEVVLIIINVFCYFVTLLLSKKTGNNFQMLKELFIYYPCVLLGYIISKYGIFTRISNKWSILNNTLVCLVGCILIFIFRYVLGYKRILDILLIGPWIYFLIGVLKKCNIISMVLLWLSKHSTNFWFLHGIFFFGNRCLQSVLYKPKFDLLILLWSILILSPISYIIDFFYKKTCKIINNIID